MTTYLNPKTGATIGYQETKGTTAEPFMVQMVWQPSTLSYIALSADSSGNLNTSGSGGGGGATTIADGADTAEGSIDDSAVYGDTSGTISAKLRGISALLQGHASPNAPQTAAITNTDSVALVANGSRKSLVITNLGGTNCYFGINHAAVLLSGIVLTPNGTWVMSRYTFSTGDIHAICATTTTLAIQEYQ